MRRHFVCVLVWHQRCLAQPPRALGWLGCLRSFSMPVVADVDVVGLLEEVRRHIAKAENAIARVLQGPEVSALPLSLCV